MDRATRVLDNSDTLACHQGCIMSLYHLARLSLLLPFMCCKFLYFEITICYVPRILDQQSSKSSLTLLATNFLISPFHPPPQGHQSHHEGLSLNSLVLRPSRQRLHLSSDACQNGLSLNYSKLLEAHIQIHHVPLADERN